MGSNNVGIAMCVGASAAIDVLGGIGSITQEQALKILDTICEPWRGVDAEFDGGADPDESLGLLIAKAFALGDDWVLRLNAANSPEASEEATEDFWDAWCDARCESFNKRYNFW